MTVTRVITAPAMGGFFYDDQKAIRSGVDRDGFVYRGDPQTPGFENIRIPGAALGIGFMLSDGTTAWGDAVSVQYSGTAGRDPLFDPVIIEELVRQVIAPRIVGRAAPDLIGNTEAVMAYVDGARLPIAVEYGVSQALLRAAAIARNLTMAEVICADFGLTLPCLPIPLFAQSGDDRYLNVDKMILKSVDILPHGLINSREKFGRAGEVFLEYARWVAARTQEIGRPGYRPVLHFDFYGWIGIEIGQEPSDIARYIARIAEAVPGFELNVECPADYGSLDAQLDAYADIVEQVDQLCPSVRIVADEYCNTLSDVERFCDARAAHIIQIKTPDVGNLLDTVRAIRYAKSADIGAYSGGSCAETDLSARACVHVAVASAASMMLAKPGMGVDEGIAIVGNEQSRLLATIRSRQQSELAE
ncbi:MAG: methylaspartate ammonia-lyase [Sphingomonas sp. 28-63-12]|nr:MAG: methylaspartate ammonia-lyase [Sphingomonas sp. 28-63-12]